MTTDRTQYYEVNIPVPFGIIAGKWYGSKDVRPILFIHGFNDNCGTFDRLIPLLPSRGSYLAIDLPGCGLSSRTPNGMMYHVSDLVLVILWIMKTYQWSKVSLVGHSMGAMACYCFIGFFPAKVDLFIAMDALQLSHFEQILDQQAYFFTRSMQANEDNVNNVSTSEYTYEQLIEKVHNLPSCTIPKELCPCILRRNISKSKTLPESYCFHYDSRTKYPYIMGWSKEASAMTAKRIKFPVLIIRANDSLFYGDEEEFFCLVETLKQNNTHTKLVHTPGGHYFHLIVAERIATEIEMFLGEIGYYDKAVQSKM
ncbi:AAEL004487-PA [Aedes aegypti]|uniref:AAEL004487-PA n=2 Tax=Aedes aegypti TaxID=7159 RepID=A0A1S4F7Q9_AEDAE|nr:probable serine hydrolase [Aedes aegypti]EAT44102.1 AAEL004487-PA [Aedes aegypti]